MLRLRYLLLCVSLLLLSCNKRGVTEEDPTGVISVLYGVDSYFRPESIKLHYNGRAWEVTLATQSPKLYRRSNTPAYQKLALLRGETGERWFRMVPKDISLCDGVKGLVLEEEQAGVWVDISSRAELAFRHAGAYIRRTNPEVGSYPEVFKKALSELTVSDLLWLPKGFEILGVSATSRLRLRLILDDGQSISSQA